MDAFASSSEATGAGADTNASSMLAFAPAKDETALWLGAAAGDDVGGRSEDESYLTSLGSGGALMSAGGGWSISTFPGEEGLRWSGVKTEQLFDEWASGGGGKQQATASELVMRSSPLLATAAAAAAAAAADKGSVSGSDAKLLAKSDTEEGWKEFVGPPRASTKLPSAGGYSPSSFPPASSEKKPQAPVASPGLIKLPAALPTTPGATHSADSSTKDNIAAFAQHRSSSRAAAAKTLTTAKPATATTTATATRTVPPRAATTATPPTRAAAATKTRAAAAAAAAAAVPPTPPPLSAAPAVTTRTRRSAAAAAVAAASAAVKGELAEDDQPADNNNDDDDDDDDEEYVAGGRKKKATTAKKSRRASIDSDDEADPLDSDDPVGSELTDKRRRNREHAKRSRLRKRVRLGGLEEMVLGLRRENVRLRQMVMSGIPDRADAIIRTCASDNTNADVVSKQDVVQGMRPGMSVGSSSSSWSARGGTRKRPKAEGGSGGGGASSSGGRKDHRVPSALKLMSPCYQTVKALVDSQANFILTNPNLPDCPIIFASQGFLELTGYEGKDVIGKNCRFLQGPGTDAMTLSIVRNNLAAGRDVSVCILNYKKNGTPFWNQLSIGVLLDAHGQVANHVGVMCEVSQMPPAVFHRLLHRVPLPESLLHDDSGSESDGEDDHVERSRVSAGSFKHSDGAKSGGSLDNIRSRASSVDDDGDDSGSATGRSSSGPRVVDRLRRTRAAAAAIGKK